MAEQCWFEVYDPDSKTVLAVRTQYPFKLAYGLTVHRAQGQTVQNVEIDCHSFFAPGQMGVAVGRAVRISGLRIVNYNSTAAHLKHPQVVYDFYSSASAAANADLSCCRKFKTTDATGKQTGDQKRVSKSNDNCSLLPNDNSSSMPSTSGASGITSPWPLEDFFKMYNTSTHMPENVSDDFI